MGGVLALALARELTPVVTSIIVAGRVGSAFAAELGTMQARGGGARGGSAHSQALTPPHPPHPLPPPPPPPLAPAMQVSEQTDSLRVLGSDPVDYLITPRVMACMIATPILNLMCFCMGEARAHSCRGGQRGGGGAAGLLAGDGRAWAGTQPCGQARRPPPAAAPAATPGRPALPPAPLSLPLPAARHGCQRVPG